MTVVVDVAVDVVMTWMAETDAGLMAVGMKRPSLYLLTKLAWSLDEVAKPSKRSAAHLELR